jgi:methylated-DNA-protein-cysteine methyltransferase-like protein
MNKKFKRKESPSRSEKSKTALRGSRTTNEAFDKVFEKIYRLVLRIPRGRVMTYGQIARLLEERYSPRLVGWAMHATPKDERNIPWHRVINSRGTISTGRVIIAEPDRQRLMLEAEGIVFDSRGHCDLSVYQWSPRQRSAQQKIKTLLTEKKIGARKRVAGRKGSNNKKGPNKRMNQRKQG